MRGGAAVLAAAALFATAAITRAAPPAAVADAVIMADDYPPALSAFRFFTDLPARTPAARVVPYHLNTPLFSDYAEKQRYLYVPAGAKAGYEVENVLALPVGSALIKTFGYGQGAAFRPLETRVLLHRAAGWVALPYVWNADRTDAVLKRAGTRIPVTFTTPAGPTRSISYAVICFM